REQMRLEVKHLQKRLNIAVLFVTHDQVEALSLSDRIALMNFGEIQQQGDPRHLYEAPTNEFVRDFVGKTLLFKGKVAIHNPSGHMAIAITGAPDCTVFGRTYDPESIKAGDDVFLGIRPEDVELLPAISADVPPGIIGGTVLAALFVGERTEYQIDVDGQRAILIYGDRHQPLGEGDKVWLRPRPDGHSAWPSDRSMADALDNAQ
ncbi:MAG: iron(III) transport system ATP-binding protein, partial [Alphaproteobacteria bacterium]